MEEGQKRSAEKVQATATAMDVEFLPLVLFHKIHRNLKSSQVEIVPVPYYYEEPTTEPESEPEVKSEPEVMVPAFVFAPPLPALKEKNNWWDFAAPVYAFDNPLIRSRLEKLMSTNIVFVTDRKYMIRLQERIKEDHLESLKKRIREREADEVDREKNLLLEGKIAFEEAPKALKNHPVCKINQIARKIIEEKRAKMKPADRTWAYKTSLKRLRRAEKEMKETSFEKETEEEHEPVATAVCVVDAETEEDISKGFMYSKEEYHRLRHEDSLIKLFREIEEIEELYEVADKIVASFKAVEDFPKSVEDRPQSIYTQ